MAKHPVPPSAVVFAGILSLAAAMGIGRFAFTPLMPLMIAEGRLDVAVGGWIAAANYAGYLAGALTASRLRWSAVRLAVTALALTALLTAAMALPLAPWLWGVLRFAAGVASAWAFVATAIWCLGALARASRGDLAGAVYSGVGFGIAAAGVYCVAGSAWHASADMLWLQLGAIVLVLLVPIAVVLHRLNGAAAGAMPAPPARAAGGENIRALVVCYGALGFGYILPATFLPVMARSLVQDPRIFGLAWPVFGITAAASTFVAAWVLRHASRLQVWAVSNVVMGVGTLLPSVWLNGFTIALSALCVGGTFMIVTLAGVQEVRARAHGDATPLVARMTASFALGQIAGPIASSLLLHVPGFAQHGLDVALQLAAASLFLSAAWLWRADRSRTLTHPEVSHAR
ncbi:YbfB/YjiJ family MFS transporter [Ramlibacter sp. PS4R-6]|uniref:YbfB/YjiJ family MFS transporter n=1 Tax=Ramlibacter sp. PS4R-6 TaxID=3133438 RepID=UPI0030A12A79